jgi:hypothetical protein
MTKENKMNFLRCLLAVVLISLTTVAFAQSDAQKSVTQTDTQKSFDKLKTLAGAWQGKVTVDPPQPEMSTGKPVQITLRVTSRGNALVHEMQEAGTPLDPTKYDHPVTMLYVDNGRLTLIHYCDAGNRPRMLGKMSPDGKKVEFDFAELSGGNQYGHMYHAVFTFLDPNHHIEDWTYMMPGDKPVHAHMDLVKTN